MSRDKLNKESIYGLGGKGMDTISDVSKMDDLFIKLKIQQNNAISGKQIFVGCANFLPDNYPGVDACPIPLVSDIVSSKFVSSTNSILSAKITDVAFRYLMQLEFFDASVTLGDNAQMQWEENRTIENQIMMASSLQHQVICSRIALECFFDLIRVCGSGERFKGNGKFKSYRKWITTEGTPYNKFLPLILVGWRFDRTFRTPEVHGTSRLPYEILNSKLESSDIWKIRFSLNNALRMSWNTLLDIVNEREGGMYVSLEDSDIANEIFRLSKSDTNELEIYLKKMCEERMIN